MGDRRRPLPSYYTQDHRSRATHALPLTAKVWYLLKDEARKDTLTSWTKSIQFTQLFLGIGAGLHLSSVHLPILLERVGGALSKIRRFTTRSVLDRAEDPLNFLS